MPVHAHILGLRMYVFKACVFQKHAHYYKMYVFSFNFPTNLKMVKRILQEEKYKILKLILQRSVEKCTYLVHL